MKNNDPIKKNKKELNTWVEFTQIGIQMAVTITVFVFLGVWLDEKYPNNYHAFSIIFSLFGVFSALYFVIKKVIRMSKKKENSSSK